MLVTTSAGGKDSIPVPPHLHLRQDRHQHPPTPPSLSFRHHNASLSRSNIQHSTVSIQQHLRRPKTRQFTCRLAIAIEG